MNILLGLGLSLLLFPNLCYAYVDPNAGSLLLQLLLGGVAGVVIFFKLFWKRLKDKFSKKN